VLFRSDHAFTILVLAEKPSVARDIARVLGTGRKGEGFLEGKGYRVVVGR
jgi:DNA topoisomerase-3